MNKTNKHRISKRRAKDEPLSAICESCGYCFYSYWLLKDNGKYYCSHCHAIGIEAQSIKNQVKDKEIEKMLKSLLNTPTRKRSKNKKKK